MFLLGLIFSNFDNSFPSQFAFWIKWCRKGKCIRGSKLRALRKADKCQLLNNGCWNSFFFVYVFYLKLTSSSTKNDYKLFCFKCLLRFMLLKLTLRFSGFCNIFKVLTLVDKTRKREKIDVETQNPCKMYLMYICLRPITHYVFLIAVSNP